MGSAAVSRWRLGWTGIAVAALVMAASGSTAAADAASAVGSQSAVADSAGWLQVDSDVSHSCGVRTDQTLWCWGYNGTGQLGDGSTTTRLSPVQVGTELWLSVAAGDADTCAIKTDHTLWCWGLNRGHQFGIPGREFDVPAQVGKAANWDSVSAGYWNTCAIRTNGTLWCWGNEEEGELGNGERFRQELHPAQVGTESDWVMVSASRGAVTCGLRANGTAWCWGDSPGNGSNQIVTSPRQVDESTDYVWVATEEAVSCGIKRDGTLWCWGGRERGDFGDGSGDPGDIYVPEQIGTATWVSVSSNYLAHTCGVQTNGTLWCWGAGKDGQLGQGRHDRLEHDVPVQVGHATNWSGVTTGYRNSHGWRSNGSLYGWGSNFSGTLGDGTEIEHDRPVRIDG